MNPELFTINVLKKLTRKDGIKSTRFVGAMKKILRVSVPLTCFHKSSENILFDDIFILENEKLGKNNLQPFYLFMM